MSIIAKVFSIVVLVFSAAFVSLALVVYGQHTYWKPKFYAEKAQNIEVKERMVRDVSKWKALAGYYDSQRSSVAKELEETKFKVRELENEKTDREEALAVEYQKNFRVVAQLMETVREISRMNRVLKQRQDVITKQQQALQIARQNEASMAQQVADLKRQNNQLIQNKNEIAYRTTQLEADLEAARDLISAYVSWVGTIEKGETPGPPISGRVAAVQPETGFVTIDKGSQNGVKIGFKFWIYREKENKLVGRVKVVSVQENLCGAEIMPEYQRAPIQINDSAATNLER